MDRSKAISSSKSSKKNSSSKSSKKNSSSLKPVRCGICTEDFRGLEALTKHQTERHSLVRQKASISAVETGQEDEDKKIDDEEMKKWFSFECFECNLVIQTAEAFIEHNRELHPSPPPQRSQLSVSLVLQKLQEEDYKKYLDEEEKGRQPRTPCQFCERKFSSSEDLDQHISEDHHLLVIGSLSAVKTGQKDEKEIGDVDVDEEDKEIWLTNENAINALRMYAQVALQHYNNQNLGKRYALVAPGLNVAIGSLTHINFKAKEEDCLDAPVETFFAQLTFVPFMRVDCCVSLGPSHKLPNWRKEAELNGCRFCRPIINHPRERVANLILDPYSGHF